MKIIFKSENILFTNMSKRFFDDYFKMFSNSEIQKLIFTKVYSKEQISNWIIRLINEKRLIFTMIEKSTNEFIGSIEIVGIKDNIGEIAICITPDKQGKHYSTESMNAIMEYCINNFGLNEFELSVYKNNSRAIHCYERVGFTQSGIGISGEDIHMKIKM